MWTRRTKSRPGALIHHSTAHMHGSSLQHSTSQHCTAPRGVVGAMHNATRRKARFSLAEAVCVFLRAQAAFLPARPKPSHALLPVDCKASLVTYESKCAVFQRKQASNTGSHSQSIHKIPPDLLDITCRSSNSHNSLSESISCYFNSSGSFPSSQA